MRKFKTLIIALSMVALGCSESPELKSLKVEITSIPSLVGSWKLLSSQTIVGGDTTFKSYTENMEAIKMINDTHFSFFQHDLNDGKDSLVSGAGKYILKGNTYIEFLEYCSANEWEKNRFEFEIIIQGDTLIQTGRERIEALKVDQIIMGTYVRANDLNTPVPIENEFNEEEISWFANSGTGSIKGVAKFRSNDGTVKYGSQFRIELMPYTSYTEERLTKIYGSSDSGAIFVRDGVPRFIPDPHGYHETIQTQCDKAGVFEFTQLPQGDYYLVAFMLWDDKHGLKGGGIMRKVSLKERGQVELEMLNFSKE